jgi:hypothetical protein
VVTGIAVLGSGIYIAEVGGVAPLFASRQDLNTALVDAGVRGNGSEVGSALLGMIGTVPAFVALLGWSLVLMRQGRDRHVSIGAVLAWCTTLGVNVLVNNPISNARYWVLTMVIAFAYALPQFKPRTFRTALIVGILGALVIFPYSDPFRL